MGKRFLIAVMPKPKTTELIALLTHALAMRESGRVVDAETLVKELKVTRFGASCLMFMLDNDQYFPELEKIFEQDDVEWLKSKNPEEFHLIEFLEDMPPYKKKDYVGDPLTEQDKALYVKMGMAAYVSFEDFRQKRIRTFVTLARLIDQYRADLREAIAHNDQSYITSQFEGQQFEEIKNRLKKYGLAENEIDTALEIYRAASDL